MRIILKIAIMLLAFSANLSAQNDFMALDRQTYDFYLKDDFKNLEKQQQTICLNRGLITITCG